MFMKIREVRTDDAKEIAEIYNHYVRTSTVTFDTVIATEEMTRNRIEAIASRYPYYVCEDEGRVVGYAYAHEWKGRGAYHNTLEASAYVLDGMTGRGIGRKLMECLINDCRKRGFHALIACITTGNEASERMVKSFGFYEASHFREVGYKFGQFLDDSDYELLL